MEEDRVLLALRVSSIDLTEDVACAHRMELGSIPLVDVDASFASLLVSQGRTTLYPFVGKTHFLWNATYMASVNPIMAKIVNPNDDECGTGSSPMCTSSSMSSHGGGGGGGGRKSVLCISRWT